MKFKSFITLLFLCFTIVVQAQHHIKIDATLEPELRTIVIHQEISYKNYGNTSIREIYLNDWANSFSSKTTPLGIRFSENYQGSFHFEKNKNRGRSNIHSVENNQGESLVWQREKEVDIIRVKLDKNLAPGETYTMKFEYSVVLPDDKFTRYGITNNGDFKVRYWYLSPAVFDGEWHAYSNKDLNDFYLRPSIFNIRFTTPNYFKLVSDLDVISEVLEGDDKVTTLTGEQRMQVKLHLLKTNDFTHIETNKMEVVTNLTHKKVTPPIRALVIDRVVQYLDSRLGDYPFEKIMLSEIDYKRNPVYGLNLLPDFISPFPDGFEYDIEILKILTRTYLENTLSINPREDHWLLGAIQVYLMMDYVNTYYPNMKLVGNLTNLAIVRWFYASNLEFNEQYSFLYMNMARNNLMQKLTTPKDSLLEFNKNIASDYYGGSGLKYLEDYLKDESVLTSIQEFYKENKLQPVTSIEYKYQLEKHTDLPIDWFFEDYINNRSTIDFSLKKPKVIGDSIQIQVVNNRDKKMPVSIYGINKKEIVYKKWLPPIDSITTVTLPAKDVRKVALNYEGIIPEFNQRNNYKKIKGLFNKPLQVRLFKDVEDPKYNQIFVMPEYGFNIYDGLALGPKLYNKTILPKTFHYRVEPLYAFRSKKLVGSGSLSLTKRPEFTNLYNIRAGVAGSYFSYDEDLFFKRFAPFLILSFRDHKNLRNNKKHFVTLRNVTIDRDKNPNKPLETPNYSVFNFRYTYSNPNLIDHYRANFDYQISSEFSKVSTTLKYRKLFLSNRQIDVRLFAGVFLKNNSNTEDDFFSFALDRPTDYLFDYNYYGRSEDTGLFSQQLIIAEGGFKSQLEPAFSNTWMTTLNVSTNIWRWIHAYGDVGFVNNKNLGTETLFDSGLRLALVEDYFELYFPVYSSIGWEMGQPNYEEKIRFIITIDPSTLFGLFSRKWY